MRWSLHSWCQIRWSESKRIWQSQDGRGDVEFVPNPLNQLFLPSKPDPIKDQTFLQRGVRSKVSSFFGSSCGKWVLRSFVTLVIILLYSTTTNCYSYESNWNCCVTAKWQAISKMIRCYGSVARILNLWHTSRLAVVLLLRQSSGCCIRKKLDHFQSAERMRSSGALSKVKCQLLRSPRP